MQTLEACPGHWSQLPPEGCLPLSLSASGHSNDLSGAEGLEVEQVERQRFERTCEGIVASIRLRVLYPVQRFQNALPWWRAARRVSFLAIAARQSFLHERTFLRIWVWGWPGVQ